MKTLLFLFFFFELIKLSFSLNPIWNLETSTINLDIPKEIKIFEKNENEDCPVLLTKNIE